ncbi:ParA family protein [Desulfococcaceae bacterium HSG8]|nr:ParA family protein [Desulfococcaceae bacterium HSG8]
MPLNYKYLITADELSRLTGQSVKETLTSFDKKKLIELPESNKIGIPPPLIREYLGEKGVDYSFRVIAHMNMKGGVGKTTSAISVATRAVQYGFRTCILDMDPQACASQAFERRPEDDELVFYDIWRQPSEGITKALKIIDDHFYIIPSSLGNSLLDSDLTIPDLQKKAVQGVCEALKVKGFDLVLIDCPPSPGAVLISTICATDILVIPLCGEAFSFEGMELTFNEVISICKAFGIKPPDIKILYTKYDKRVKISGDILQRLATKYREYLIPVPIRISTEFSKAIEKRETVFASAKKNVARDDYDRYVKYLLKLSEIEY